MSISPTEVLKLYKVSKPTLYKDMSEGRISFELTEKGKRRLQPAELDRVYDKKEEQGASSDVSNRSNDTNTDVSLNDMVPVSVFNTMIEQTKAQYEAQISSLERTLEKAQDITLLIEGPKNQKKEDDNKAWKKTVEALEGQVTNERKLHQKELIRSKRLFQEKKKLEIENELLKARINHLESRSMFRKLFKKSNADATHDSVKIA